MVRHIVGLIVANATAEQFYDFMIDPSDEAYGKWWPEEHFQFHITKRGKENHVDDRVFFDEKIGSDHRLKFHAVVLSTKRPNIIVWQMMKFGIWLPAYLELRFIDSTDGVVIEHELRVGYKSFGKLFDPFIRLYMNKSYLNALEKHCKEEWPKLASLLNNEIISQAGY